MRKAQKIACDVVGSLWGRGVFAVEMFLVGDGIIVNEVGIHFRYPLPAYINPSYIRTVNASVRRVSRRDSVRIQLLTKTLGCSSAA